MAVLWFATSFFEGEDEVPFKTWIQETWPQLALAAKRGSG